MQLVEKGKLSWSSPPARRSGDGIGAGCSRAATRAQAITPAPAADHLAHLLTHTAGFSYEIWRPEIARYQTATGTPGITTCTNAALTTPLLFDPGDRWDYGINIDWAGKMVEAASGDNLDRYFKDHILRPLGMHDTSFKISPSQRLRLARIHQRDDKGALTAVDLELPQEPEFYMGGGGLYGTAGITCFTRMILQAAHSRYQGFGSRRWTSWPEPHRPLVGLPLRPRFPRSPLRRLFPGPVEEGGLIFLIIHSTPGGRSSGSLSGRGS